MMTSSAALDRGNSPVPTGTYQCRLSVTAPQQLFQWQRHHTPNSDSTTTDPPTSRPEPLPRRSRTPKDVAKRLFDQAILSPSTRALRRRSLPAMQPAIPRVVGGGISGIPSHNFPTPHACSSTSASPSTVVATSGGSTVPLPAPPMTRRRSSATPRRPLSMPAPLFEKPQASSNGGAVTMTIQLAEPILFLQGLDGGDNLRIPSMLRGSLILGVMKPTKIKAVTLTFRGRARTEWPEGIPPKKTEYFEEKEIIQHTWPFFNSQFTTAELGHCADFFLPREMSGSDGGTLLGSAVNLLARSNSEYKGGMQISQSRSYSKVEAPRQLYTAHRGYRLFQPGDYVYDFELPLDSCLPETLSVDLGSVKYQLDGCIERPGAFRPNLTGKKEVILVRVPSEVNLEQTEPITISRTWEDQLHYDIVISGKAFPLGSSIPIAFKLTPLAKVRCHRIKVYITENVEYSCKNKTVHRLDTVKKVQLFEKRAEAPATSAFSGSSVRVTAGGGLRASQTTAGGADDLVNLCGNLLGDLTGSPNIGPTEMEFNVQLPGCNAKERERIHFDTTYGNIQVHHWIKIVLRLSKQDPANPSNRRHFEISIDSPFHILSCQATHRNTTLPAYGVPQANGPSSVGSCLCLHAAKHRLRGGPSTVRAPNGPTTIPGIERPIHLIRYPSTNPPPFDADVSPPLVTPPPKYEMVADSSEGLAGYFSRLANHYATLGDDDTDDDSSRRGGLLLPLTPGGRAVRSLDERRTW